MGRPRKADPAELIRIVDEYFEAEVDGNPGKLMFNKIAGYAATKGYVYEEYHFRRDADVRKHIEELKESLHDVLQDKGIVAYKSLDVDGIIKQCLGLEDLKLRLYEMDTYWKKAYLEVSDMSQKYYRILRERQSDRDEVRACRKAVEDAETEKERLVKELNAERRQTAYLRNFIRENVYPEVARQILKEHYIQTDVENKIIKPEAFNRLVEGKHPKSFDGEQEKPEPKKSPTDRLVEELERQVDSYE